ncbi:hypothetical protein [Chromobacterium phragmitis]|uniref:Ig-like domain-containing protein n=1 Tax=Chromobacterium phragmitis TaxID=2202141 RepID=A0ABV0IPS9_9NEIS
MRRFKPFSDSRIPSPFRPPKIFHSRKANNGAAFRLRCQISSQSQDLNYITPTTRIWADLTVLTVYIVFTHSPHTAFQQNCPQADLPFKKAARPDVNFSLSRDTCN